MERKRMSKSLRKYIRQEKARIHRGVLDLKEQRKLIDDLYQKTSNQHEDKRNLQSGNK